MLTLLLAFARPVAAQLQAYAPTVTPDGSTVSALEGSAGLGLTFFVTNNSEFEEYFTASCSAAGVIPSCEAPSTIVLAAGATTTVTVTYSTAAVGSGAVYLSVFGQGGDDLGFYNINVIERSYRVGVTPDGQAVTPAAFASASQSFTVTNLGNGAATYNLAATCGPPAAMNCAGPASVTLDAGAATTVTVSYQAGRQGAQGTVRLRASYIGNIAVQDDGSAAVTVGAGVDAPVLDVAAVNPGAVTMRHLCLTTPAGLGAAYQCAALRIAHALPTTRLLNVSRTPFLVYNSQLAHPRPIVKGIVTLPGGGSVPDSVTARVLINGTQRATGSWQGSDWTGGSARTIALSVDALDDTTGLYAYTLEVTRHYTAGPQTSSAAGELLIVNRKNSYFGAGWWLAGLERLRVVGGGGIAWESGDGSAAVYRQVLGVTNRWTATGTDRPDTLIYDATALTYLRKLPHGATVTFDRWGNHLSTTDRRGQVTAFSYTGDSLQRRLRGIALPGWRAGDTYRFNVSTVTDRLDSIQSPATSASAAERVTRIAMNSGRVAVIRDPMGDSVSFGYTYADSGAPNLIGTRTDRRGTVTRFTFGSARALVRATIELDGVNRIETAFQPQETRGMAGGTAVAPDSAYTFIDGPRPDSDAPDHVRAWADGQGAVRRIRNAVGHETLITRGDGRFPGLVTEMKGPTGLVSWAMYDRRGNLETSSDVRPFADTRNATTAYVWDQKWDFVKRIILPAGELRAIEYDGTNGNRLWEEDARGGTHRTSYSYYTAGIEKDLLRAVVRPDGTRDSVAYDTLGNVRLSRTPLGHEIRYENDRVGRTLVVRSQIDSGNYSLWQDDSTTYDVMDRVTRSVSYGPAVGDSPQQRLILRNEYGAEGHLTLAERTISPEYSPTPLGPITTRWEYDRAGRKLREIAPDGAQDSLVHDAAGNLTEWHTRRRDAAGNRYVVRMAYDTLNRLRERVVPRVDYPERSLGIATLAGLTDIGGLPYGGLSIPASTTRFWYNALGQVDSATNADATVRRRYYPNGLLRHDSLFIRWSHTASTNAHAYGLTYEYDVNGRRTALVHPGQLAPRQGSMVYDRTSYAYDTITGLPTRITDPLGNRFAFLYNVRDELQWLTYPFHSSGPTEEYSYDADGRRLTHAVYGPTSTLRSTSYRYDAQSRLLRSSNSVMMKDTLTARYSGLGHLSYSRYRAAGVDQLNRNVAQTVETSFTNDALGNVSNATDASTTLTNSGWSTSSSFTSTPWFARFQPNVGRLIDKYFSKRSDAYLHDAAGNVEFSYTKSVIREAPVPPEDDRASFYAADGQLRAADYRWVAGHTDATAEGAMWQRVFETYRYDPLGRRILVRTLRTCDYRMTGTCRMGTIRRTVWDGEQELYEIQMPGDSTESSTWLENDTAYVTSRTDSSSYGYTDRNPYFGRVAYTHGLGIDQPLGIIRMQYASRPSNKTYQQWGRFSIYPHWNARGEADLGAINNGAWNYCPSFSDGQRCLDPWWYKGSYAYHRETSGRAGWLGTVVESKEDGARTLYRRNRSYDPQSGRFTQEDPIGLAGGLNLYGYAGGDPLSYSDPFGLCTPWPECLAQGLANWGAVRGGAVGDVALNVGAAANAALEAGGVNDASAGIAEISQGNVGKGLFLLGTSLPTPAGKGGKILSRADVIIETALRKTPGGDGGIAAYIKEKVAGKTISVTQQVTVGGKIVHQHQEHIGKYGTHRRFPDEWVEHPHIGVPD